MSFRSVPSIRRQVDAQTPRVQVLQIWWSQGSVSLVAAGELVIVKSIQE
jgi:hypothetical protein